MRLLIRTGLPWGNILLYIYIMYLTCDNDTNILTIKSFGLANSPQRVEWKVKMFILLGLIKCFAFKMTRYF